MLQRSGQKLLDWKAETKNILFLTADLVGSTNYKQYYSKEGKGHQWVRFFELFYEEFPNFFQSALRENKFHHQAVAEIWKTLGDEIIFKSIIRNYRQVEVCVSCFISAIHKFRDQIIERKKLNAHQPIDIKGACWIGEFPVQNSELQINGTVDYFGPSIDTGFRLSKLADKRKFIVSIEVARLLIQQLTDFSFYFDGTVPLKGVLEGKPYPIIWIDIQNDSHLDIEADLRTQVDHKKLRGYCEHLFSDQRIPLQLPFFPDGEDFTAPYNGYVAELEKHKLFEQDKDIPTQYINDDHPTTSSSADEAKLLSNFEASLQKNIKKD